MGLVNMQTAKSGDFASQNYTAFSFSQRVLERSNIKGYFLNRQAFMTEEEKKANPLNEFGRNAGTEFTYSDKSGAWNVWSGYHLSMKPDVKKANSYFALGGGYFGKKVEAFVDFNNLGENYYTDMGFVQRIENYDAFFDTVYRQGYRNFKSRFSYNIFPKKSKAVNNHTISVESATVWNYNGLFAERNSNLTWSSSFKNTAMIELIAENNDTRLQYYIAFTDDNPLPPGIYKYSQYAINYTSDTRKKFNYTTGVRAGSFYNGNLQQYVLSASYRIQPWGSFTLNLEYNKIEFPAPFGKTNLLLVAPRVELNFSNNLFWTTFLQYNTQANNFNINSRLQWRYKPMSDIFLVYTDNYFSEPFLKSKNRAIVFKMNYWLNL